MGEMVESIRTARIPESAPSETYDEVIPIAQRNSITVWTDIDRDANHDLELVRYRVDTTHRILYRDQATITENHISWTSEKLVSPNVSNGQNPADATDQALWLFTYYDANGCQLPYDDHEGDDSSTSTTNRGPHRDQRSEDQPAGGHLPREGTRHAPADICGATAQSTPVLTGECPQ